MRLNKYVGSLVLILGFVVQAYASGVPGNEYCGAGNVPSFGSQDGPALLPQTCFYTGMDHTPSPGKLTTLNASNSWKDLNNALANASCGDIIEIAAGVTLSGPSLTLPAHGCSDSQWITLRTSAYASLPPEGTRVSPCYAGVASLSGRPAYNCPAGGPASLMATIQLGSGGSVVIEGDHYRLIGLEITHPDLPKGQVVYQMINTAGSDHVIVDRVWIHGNYDDETGCGVAMVDSNHVAVIDSYISDMHYRNDRTGADAHAVCGGNNTTNAGLNGTFKVVNNFLEGSTENLMFGGGASVDTSFDFEIRRNFIFKPMIWNPADPSYNGIPVTVKNLFELKNAQRMLAEGNVLENAWNTVDQTGHAILLNPKNQNSKQGALCPNCIVNDITMRYGYSTHTGGSFVISDGPNQQGAWAYSGHDFSLHDLVFDAMFYPTCYECGDFEASLGNGNGTPGNPPPTTDILYNVLLNHITEIPFLPNSSGGFLTVSGFSSGTGVQQQYNISLINGIFGYQQYGVHSAGGQSNCAGQPDPLSIFNACWTNYTVTANGMVGANVGNGGTHPWPSGNYLNTNDFPSVNFVNLNNGSGGDYHLCHGPNSPAGCAAASPFINLSTDGKDLGADIDAVNCMTYEVTIGGPMPTNCSALLQALTLNLPAYLPINAQISATYTGIVLPASYRWTLTPQAFGSAGAPAVAGAAGENPAAAFSTPSPMANLGSITLGLGPYLIAVTALDNNGNQLGAAQANVTLVPADLSSVHVYPNPWRSDKHAGRLITFDNLSVNTSIKIFTVSGHHVKTLPTSSTTVTWDLTNDSGDKVASGLYIYLLKDDADQKKTGQIAIIK